MSKFSASQMRTVINVEDGADVTDAANVDAAGAVMNSDTSSAAMQFVIDEDSFATDSATKVPTQQSTKAYVGSTASTYLNFAIAAAYTGSRTVNRLSGTQTLGGAFYTNTTSGTATWTLPAITGNSGTVCFVKNAGTGNLTLQRAGSDNLFTTTTVTSYVLAPGDSASFVNDGVYWQVIA